MKKNEIKKEEVKEETPVLELSELDELIIIHKFMKDRGYNSIGDLEVRMSRLV